jgi:hypothetical protein
MKRPLNLKHRLRKRRGNDDDDDESRKLLTEHATVKYERWEEAEDDLIESGRFNLEREVMLQPAIFIFFTDYFLNSYTALLCTPSIPEHRRIHIALLCLPRTQPSIAFLIYGYTDSTAQHSAVT